MQQVLGLSDTQIRTLPFRHKNPRAMLQSFHEMKSCDLILDFTGGDSFSDIYGVRRLLRKLLHKQMAITSKTPLLLAPQTYGPLTSRVVKPWFIHVIKQAAEVFTRDDLSADFLRRLTDRDPLVATDVAVTLPWDPNMYPLAETTRRRIGLNVSGLLWNGGYTGDNQFNLTTDYREYCHSLITALQEAGSEVDLVPHVLTREWESAQEDDVRAALHLQEAHPECTVAPRFASPVEAKSYISQLDGFIGSRMHATIASFTSGVPTVPVAYSRKFAGFFGNLGYDVLVDLSAADSAQALEQTLGYLSDLDLLSGKAAAAAAVATQRIDIFTESLRTHLSSTASSTVKRIEAPPFGDAVN
ncbi:polysaccharide pyruvyl transferase family protein [Microlunatus aurantiacus]|uniref:Polysaccharide pyruvyl transferase family protein n=1 Tax=Microlunatus aurantiacus TaxID=446786 RepID=A0ABP7DLH8_9ACTN